MLFTLNKPALSAVSERNRAAINKRFTTDAFFEVLGDATDERKDLESKGFKIYETVSVQRSCPFQDAKALFSPAVVEQSHFELITEVLDGSRRRSFEHHVSVFTEDALWVDRANGTTRIGYISGEDVEFYIDELTTYDKESRMLQNVRLGIFPPSWSRLTRDAANAYQLGCSHELRNVDHGPLVRHSVKIEFKH